MRIFIDKNTIINTESAVQATNLLAKGAWEMPAKQVKAVFGEMASFANNDNTQFIKTEIGYDVTFTPPQKDKAELLQEAKQKRAIAVQNIEVEVDGMIFDGNEDAQRRIAIALQTGAITGQQSVQWVLKNNTVALVTRQQLEQVLALSMQKMQELWVLPYAEVKE